jgi:hypothetical protein
MTQHLRLFGRSGPDGQKRRRFLPGRLATSPGALLFCCLLLTLATAGCSSVALKSTPISIWDDDKGSDEYHKAIGPPENRVNAWPLLYYREPALSVLWPLIAVTDEGSAFIPFYEYSKPKEELRAGSIHQWLPSLATFNNQEDYWRVLNVVRKQGQGEDYLNALPLYYQDFKENWTLFIPFFYKDEKNFYSPIFAKGPDYFSLLLVLFNHNYTGTYSSYHVLWPIFSVWFGADQGDGSRYPMSGFKLFPLVYHSKNRGESFWNIGILLLNLWISPGETQGNYLWPLGSWGSEGLQQWNYFFPFWSWESEPIYSDDNKPPSKEVKSHFLQIFYRYYKSAEQTYYSILWPFYHHNTKTNEFIHALIPAFYYRAKTSESGKTLADKLLVTPFGGASWGEDRWTLDILGPLYIDSRDKDGTYRSILWPFYHYSNQTSSFIHALIPAFYYSAKTSVSGKPGGDKVLITPLGGGAWGEEKRTINVLGLLYIDSQSKLGRYTSVLWPLFVSYQHKDGHKTQWLLPLYIFTKHEFGQAFYSMFYSQGSNPSGTKSFRNILGLLYHESKEEGERVFRSFLFPLTGWWSSGAGDAGGWLAPLFLYNRESDGESDFIAPFWQQGTHPGGKEGYWGMLPLFLGSWAENERNFYSLPVSFGHEGDASFLNLGLILFHRSASALESSAWAALGLAGRNWEKENDTTSTWLFPIFKHKGSKDYFEFQALLTLLAGLESSRQDPETIKREMLAEIRAHQQRQAARNKGASSNEEYEYENYYSDETPLERELVDFKMLLGLARHQARMVALPSKEGLDVWNDKNPKIVRQSWGWLFPFYYYDSEEGESSHFNLLWRLYDSVVDEHPKDHEGRELPRYARQRVLWRIYHRETQGDRVSVDAFPFIAYDKAENLTQFSFLGGFFGFGSKGEEQHIKVLYLPIRW